MGGHGHGNHHDDDEDHSTNGHSSHGGHGHGHKSSTESTDDAQKRDYSVYPRPKTEGPSFPKEEVSSGFFARELTAFLAGVMFFTRIRVPSWVNHSMYWLSLSTAYFPLIGVIVGLHGFLFFSLSSFLYPPTISAILYTASTIYLTGAFHEDGLADMFDGFGGGWTREAVLRIMRDSRVGTFGCLGLFLVVLLKLAAVTDLATRVAGPEGWMAAVAARGVVGVHPLVWAWRTFGASAVDPRIDPESFLHHAPTLLRMAGFFIVAHVLGRWSCTYLLWRYPYVENHSAAGKEFLLKVTPVRLFWTTVGTGVLVGIALLPVPAFWETVVGVWVVAWAVTLWMGGRIVKVIHGVIGDCLGATNQLVELATYLALAVQWGTAAAWAVKFVV
ncbi:hypothetical protein HDU96_007876 [Phlyctochytrium bullatum]|nr:hypothetical protein HDU96_007876 [Phlyctochytrium bullatum]